MDQSNYDLGFLNGFLVGLVYAIAFGACVYVIFG
jgi:hypothetical protein